MERNTMISPQFSLGQEHVFAKNSHFSTVLHYSSFHSLEHNPHCTVHSRLHCVYMYKQHSRVHDQASQVLESLLVPHTPCNCRYMPCTCMMPTQLLFVTTGFASGTAPAYPNQRTLIYKLRSVYLSQRRLDGSPQSPASR